MARKKIGIFYCKRIKDQVCVGCAKCFKAVSETEGEYSRYDEPPEVVFMTHCGDCPGLIMPSASLMKTCLRDLDVSVDAIHLSTCIMKAKNTAACPMDLDAIRSKLEESWGVPVVLGGHDYP